MDRGRRVPDPEHSRFQLSIGLSVAYPVCIDVFFVAWADRLASFGIDTLYNDLGRCAIDAKRRLSADTFRTCGFEYQGGFHGYSFTVRHGRTRMAGNIRYRAPGIRRVFSWSGRFVGNLDRIGSPVPVCQAGRLTICCLSVRTPRCPLLHATSVGRFTNE